MSDETLVVDTVAGTFTLRVCTRKEYNQFRANLVLDCDRYWFVPAPTCARNEAVQQLVIACTVSPEPEVVRAWLDRYPALIDRVAWSYLKFLGMDTDDEAET